MLPPMRSNIEWENWGRVDPFYGVNTWPGKSRLNSGAWRAAEFYQQGRADWQIFWRHWRTYGVATTSCIEIGCGAGRITAPLAECFSQVTAFDISAEMLALAADVVPPNVQLVLCGGESLNLPENSATAAFCCQVFQHFDSIQAAVPYLKSLFHGLTHGGSLMLHVPLVCWPGGEKWNRLYALYRRVDDLRAALKRRALRKGSGRPFMRMTYYPPAWLLATLEAIGFMDTQIRIVPVPSNLVLHPLVLARKP